MANTQINQVAQAINKELTIYSNNVLEGIKKTAKSSASKLVKKTKATAPVGKRSRHYRDNIASRKLEETDRAVTYQWYVKGSDYRLSHLLENGHAKRNGKGRVEGTGFIHKAEESVVSEYVKEVEEVIKNG